MKTYLPILAWLTLLPIAGPDFINSQWECLLVMFAALVLVPKGLGLMGVKYGSWYWPIAAGLCAAYLLDTPGLGITDALAIPYLVLPVWLTILKGGELFLATRIRTTDWVALFALGYWATGAFWAICFLAGFRPVGFDPVIVSLTAAHFHVAGFVLAVAVWCLLVEQNNTLNRILASGVMAGMPLVALGITLSKLGYPNWIETLASVSFVALALLVVWQHIRLSFDTQYDRKARWYWLAGAICLLGGGTLAAVYGLRFEFPFEWINIPNMKIWHGTLNALGFGWLVLRGWEVQWAAAPRATKFNI